MGDDLVAAGQRIEEVVLRRKLTQAEAATQIGVSDTTLNVVLNGREKVGRRSSTKIMQWCGWTPDSYERLLRGEDPQAAEPERPHVQLSASGSRTLEELRAEDPDAFDGLVAQAELLLRRARERKGQP